MDRSASTHSQRTRSTPINGQQRVRGFCVKGLHVGTHRARSAVGVAVDPATKGVNLVASNATRLDRWTKPNALDKLNRVVMPAAILLNSVAAGIEEGDTDVVKRLTKVAAQQVDDAVETGELIAQTAAEQVNGQVKKAVATRKKIVKTAKAATKTATKRVSKAVADTATDTSNAARRVARKAEKVAEAA
jgi:ribosomal protein S20